MNILHEWVEHKSFGPGEIVEQTETTVTVRFDESCGEKKFPYPEAFEGYLAFCDAVFLPLVRRELAKRRALALKERREKIEAYEKTRLENLAATRAEAAAKKRKRKA